MKFTRNLFLSLHASVSLPRVVALSLLGGAAIHQAHAADLYWDGSATGWDAVGSWSTATGATTPNPAVVPGSADIANFSISIITNTAQTVNLNAARSVLGLVFNGTNTATTSLLGGGTDRTLTVAGSGITVNSLAGAVTIGSATSGQQVAVTLGADQSWTNDSLNALSVVNGVTNGGFLLTLDGTGDTSLGGVVSGAGGLTKTGAGTTTLSAANTYSGLTTVSAGSLAYGITNALSSGDVTVNGGRLNIGSFSDTVGAVTLTSGFIAGTTGALTGTSYTFNNTGATTVSAILAGSGAMTQLGSGTTTLSGANTATSAVTVRAGVLNLDYTTQDNSKLAGVLTLAGGGINLTGGTHVEAVTSTSISAGASSVTRASGTATLAQGVITRSAGGTVDYASAVATTTANVNGIVGTWATVGGADWATGTTSITGLSSYTALTSGVTGLTTNYSLAGSLTIAGTTTLGTLKISPSGAGQSLALGANSLYLGANAAGGGLLVTGTDAYTISGTGATGITGGVASNVELVVHQYNTGGLTISAIVADRGLSAVTSLTKAGSQILTLSGTNTYSGPTTISDGTLSVATIGNGGVAGNLGAASKAASNLVLAGGTLQYTGATDSTDRAFTLAAGITSTINVSTAGTTLTMSGASAATTGALIKTGAGTLALSGANPYSGGTFITGGSVSISAANNLGTGSIDFNQARLIMAVDGINLTQSINDTGRAEYEVPGANTATISGVVTGFGQFQKFGTGTLILDNTNYYSGKTVIYAGNLKLGTNGSILATNFDVLGGTFDLNGKTQGVAVNLALGTSTTSGIISGGGTISVGGTFSLVSGSISSTMAGIAPVTKSGSTTVTLSGNNTYTSTTTIAGGVLSAGNIVVSGGSSNLGNATSAVTLGAAATQGTLSYTGSNATYTRGFTIGGASGGRLDVTTIGQTLQVNTGDVTGSGLFTVGGAGNTSIGANLTHTGGLTKVDAGTLTLSGTNNTYSGATTIAAGSLSAGNIVVSGGGSNLGNATSAVTLGTASTQGTLSYTGSNATYTRGFTIGGAGGGRLDVTTPGQTLQVNTGGVTGSGLFTVGGAGNTSIGASLTHTGGLTKVDAGRLSLSGTSTFTGGTRIDNGILSLDHATDTLADTGAVDVTGGTLALGSNSDTVGAVTLTAGSITGTSGVLTGASYTLNGTVATSVGAILGGTGALTKSNGGTATLSGASTYSGLTTITGGTLAYGIANALGSGAVTVSGGVLDVGTFSDTVGAVTLTSGSITGTSGVLTGTSYALDGTGATSVGAILGGTGALTKSNGGTATLSGTNTYSGLTTITGGTLAYGAANALGSGAVTVSGGVLDVGTFSDTVGAVTLTSGSITGTSGVLTGASYALNGTVPTSVGAILGGTGALTKSNVGTATLSGANTYSGATLISGGTLKLDATGTINNTSEVSLGNGGTLDVSAKGSAYSVAVLKGSGNVTGALRVSNQLAIGNSPGTVNFSSSLTLGAGSTYLYELVSAATLGVNSADLGDIAGSLTIGSGSILDLVQLGTYTGGNKFTLFAYDGLLSGTFMDTSSKVLSDGATFTDAGGVWTIDYNDATPGANGGVSASNTFVTITAVPEPGVAVLLSGLGVLALLRRRR